MSRQQKIMRNLTNARLWTEKKLHLAPAEKLGFSLVARLLPIRQKTRLTKQLQAAQILTLSECIHFVSIVYPYCIHTVYAKKKEKKKAERKEAKERVKNKDK